MEHVTGGRVVWLLGKSVAHHSHTTWWLARCKQVERALRAARLLRRARVAAGWRGGGSKVKTKQLHSTVRYVTLRTYLHYTIAIAHRRLNINFYYDFTRLSFTFTVGMRKL